MTIQPPHFFKGSLLTAPTQPSPQISDTQRKNTYVPTNLVQCEREHFGSSSVSFASDFVSPEVLETEAKCLATTSMPMWGQARGQPVSPKAAELSSSQGGVADQGSLLATR